MADSAYYTRQAELTQNEPELARYYLGKAAEAKQSVIRPEVEDLTRQYISKLAALGVELPDRAIVEVKVSVQD